MIRTVSVDWRLVRVAAHWQLCSAGGAGLATR